MAYIETYLELQRHNETYMALYNLAATSISSLTLPFIFSWSLNSIHADCPSESHVC